MATQKQVSLLRKFNGMLILFYLVSLLLTAPAVYWITRAQTYETAHQELTLLVDMVRSIQGYVGQSLRAPLTQMEVFHSPALSGAVAINLISNHFQKVQPNYYIRFTSDNPLNPQNRSRELELDLLQRFRSDPNLTELVESGMLHGRSTLVSARPNRAVAECLNCHGDAAAMRSEITEEYGTSSGFGYTVGRVEGVMLVGVPIGHVNEIALQRSLAVIGIITLLFTFLFVAANLLVKRTIISPLVAITSMAQAVSKGQLEHKLEPQRNDEIGALAHAFELMRRSLVAMLKRNRSSK